MAARLLLASTTCLLAHATASSSTTILPSARLTSSNVPPTTRNAGHTAPATTRSTSRNAQLPTRSTSRTVPGSTPRARNAVTTTTAWDVARPGTDWAGNATNAAGANQTTWFTREKVEHFLGDPNVLHTVALALGIAAIAWGRSLPQLLAGVSSVSLGLWVGLVVQDRQFFDRPIVGGIDVPDGTWVPVVAGLLMAILAGILGLLAWRLALVLLTAGLITLIILAICRLANASPEKVMQVAGSLLSAYRIVGAVVLVGTILALALLVKRFHKGMIAFSSAHLGTLLLLSGISHFAQVAGASEAPFSLLDDFARIIAEVRGGRCHLWSEEAGGGGGLQSCDCGDRCRSEIIAWLASSITVLGGRFLQNRWRRSRKGQKPSEEEKAPLAQTGAPPEVIGAPQG
uniref:DUF4203 domain-containing protein n=1 Tax=Alexandrium monilatum TaxID=311494 RepID=A0A7S4Q0Z0_9DINO